MAEPNTLAVHRCRFIDYTPSAITALAFPPLPLPSAKGKAKSISRLKFGVLAIGHANGNIDLCEWSGPERENQSAQAWVVRKTLSGPYPSKVDSLAFSIRFPEKFKPDDVPSCSDVRLFSSGGGSDLVEWDVERGCIRRTISSQGGSIWSIAVNPSSTIVAIGCEDGSLRLLSLEHDTLTHHRRFDRVKCRILSIAWGPPLLLENTKECATDDDSDDDDDDEWGDSWLVTGDSDSSLRKWGVSSGRVIDRMGTDKAKGEKTLVWTVGVLGDGVIISGDSLGMVKFWDSRTCTQLQSFQAHDADVLCLAVGPEGTTAYTSGVDQKISKFSLVKTNAVNTIPRPSSRWTHSSSRRMHSHDVRALATWPPYTALPPSHKRQFPINIAPILASGGLDMSVVVTPAALPTSTVVKIINPLSTSTESTFEDSYQRHLAYTFGPSSTCAVRIARQARLVTCMRDNGLSVWRILRKSALPEQDSVLHGGLEADEKGWVKVMDMELKVYTNLIASAISDNGQWLVVSDLYETKLFMIEDDGKGNLKPRRVRDFSTILQAHFVSSPASTGGLAFTFTPDSTKLVMSTAMSTQVLIIDLGIRMDDQKPRVLRRFDHHRMHNNIVGDRVMKGRKNSEDKKMGGTSGVEDEAGTNSAGSVFASILRLAISADGQWLATSDDHARTHVFNLDSVQHHCVLPSFSQPIHALSFDPACPNILIMGLRDNTLHIFDVETRQFPAWSKRLCNSLPKRFTHAHDPILGVTFDPRGVSSPAPTYALFWGSTWMCKVPMNNHAPEGGRSAKKRRKESKEPSAALLAVSLSGEGAPSDFKMITRYRPLLCVDFLEAGEIVVVERPLMDVLANLPPAYFRHKYGTS